MAEDVFRRTDVGVRQDPYTKASIQAVREAGDGATGGSGGADDAHKLVDDVTYDVNDRATRVDYEDGSYRTITYTGGGLIDDILIYNSADTLLATYTANYNVSDQFTGWTES